MEVDRRRSCYVGKMERRAPNSCHVSLKVAGTAADESVQTLMERRERWAGPDVEFDVHKRPGMIKSLLLRRFRRRRFCRPGR